MSSFFYTNYKFLRKYFNGRRNKVLGKSEQRKKFTPPNLGGESKCLFIGSNIRG